MLDLRAKRFISARDLSSCGFRAALDVALAIPSYLFIDMTLLNNCNGSFISLC